jgi:hypothetical protein
MSAIFHRLGAQTLELCNGRRVNVCDIADSSVVVEKRSIVPVGPFLALWALLWVVVAGAVGIFDLNRDAQSNEGVVWGGYLMPLVLFIRRKHYKVRVKGTRGETLLLIDVPEGAQVASRMADGLMREVKKSPSFNLLEPYTPEEVLVPLPKVR